MLKDSFRQNHGIEPVYRNSSRILILGSFPSVKSRELGFYYSHPRNRFRNTIATVCNRKVPETVAEKTKLLCDCRIALWDVVGSCDISASSDSSIKNVVANDVKHILISTDVKTIFTNGKTAYQLYNKYLSDECNMTAIPLPSTSPANASYKNDDLIREWKVILEYI